MFQFIKSLSLAVLAVATAVQAYADPGTCTGHCFAHDPAMIRRATDAKYYKFNTGPGIEIASSSSLSGPWTLLGYVLPSGSSITSNPGYDDPWAPDVTLIDGVYYLYYAISTFGSQVSSIGLATSTTMDPGSWTDKGSVGITSTAGKPYNAIDPNLILVGSTYYMNFGSFYGDIYQVAMTNPPTKLAGTAAYNIEYYATGTRPCEGSSMFYYSGYYYLLWSQGICCGYDTSMPASGAEYKIQMCRSTSATGGFVDASGVACTASGGTTLLASHGDVYGPGGQGVFNAGSIGLVLYYHYANPTIGYADADYLIGYNTLTWSNGWPVV